jgi:hypothetical protein
MLCAKIVKDTNKIATQRRTNAEIEKGKEQTTNDKYGFCLLPSACRSLKLCVFASLRFNIFFAL